MVKRVLFTLCGLLLASSVFAAPAAKQNYDPSPFGTNCLKWEFIKDKPDVWERLHKAAVTMKNAGLYWDRDGIGYYTVHPKPDVWDWTFTDKLAEFTRKEGISCVILLGKPANQVPITDDARKDFAEYVYQCVNRYKGTFKIWEIWNEPNTPNFWRPSPNHRNYTLMLIEAYKAAKKADPTCVVLAGGVCGPGNDFFNGIYDNGGWNYCDGFSFHPYALASTPIQQRLDLIYRIMNNVAASHGKPKPIWVTEVGWQCKADPQDEENQAIKVFQTFVISLANGIRNTSYFSMGNYDNWGLLRSNETDGPKPSYYAVQLLTKTLGSPGPAAPFEGYLKMPANVACYVFKKSGGDRVLILWNNDEQTREVQLPQASGLKGEDIMRKPVTISNGKFTLTRIPVVITGADARAIGKVSTVYNPFIMPKGTNLILNGSLDASPDDSIPGALKNPDTWGIGRFPHSKEAAQKAKFVTSREGLNGSTCVSISESGEPACWESRLVPVEPGKTYRLTGWIKTKDARGENIIEIAWYNGDMWRRIGTSRSQTMLGTQDWTKVNVVGICPRDAMFVRVALISENNPGTTWFDNLSLVEE